MMNEEKLDEGTNGSSSITAMTEDDDVQPYELAADEIPISIKDGRKSYVIICKRPTRAQHEKRERMSKIIKRTAAKVDDQDAVTVSQDSSRADNLFVRTIALKVRGYKLDADATAHELDAQQVVEAARYLSDEEIARWDGERARSPLVVPENITSKAFTIVEGDPVVRVIDLVPATHLKVVANDLFGGSFDVERADNEVLSSRARRLHTVTQKLGVHTLEDATLSKPTHVVRWQLRDPAFEAIGKFDSRAITGTTVFLKEGGTEEHRIVSLDTCEALFDAHVDSADGAVVYGEPFNAKDPAHRAKVDVRLKKNVVMMCFNKIQAESGN